MRRAWLSVLFGLTGLLPAQDQKLTLVEELEQENRRYIRLLSDWGQLTRYGSENAELKPPAAGEARVVFFGDDIWDKWQNFPNRSGWLNRGIANQATPQMLVRFRQDVIALKPKVVVISGGTNDFAGYAGPATEGTIAENYQTMVELAKLHGIRVVLTSVTPICDCFRILSERRPAGKILGLNGWLKGLAKKEGLVYADLYAVLGQGRNFRQELTADGLVPNERGYATILPFIEKAVAEALN
ncbi:MAG: capsular biosynthesis protein [Bryobacter sp.]|jgi:lysophospholipase L1-like esterase|nr:capsular biosynthesis protein [Bryobacter sp. CoA8 C33]